jgi:hypothetical protein
MAMDADYAVTDVSIGKLSIQIAWLSVMSRKDRKTLENSRENRVKGQHFVTYIVQPRDALLVSPGIWV